ncbi:MAG: hypothetical protein PF488_00265 [Patescibacteria group bacterium]|jgi:hypothetical protein|nr:hypothetical protein [Patescibacteria group bacterium]
MKEDDILKKQKEFFERFRLIFNGTFLEEFFQVKPEEYIDPAIERKKNEMKISKMNELEKIVFTLMIRTFDKIINYSEIIGVDKEIVMEILVVDDEEAEDLVEEMQERSELMYEINEEEYPYEILQDCVNEIEKYGAFFDILNFSIYSRLKPDHFCPTSQLRKGFLIVKDAGELLEDDCSYEDEKKISSQNFRYN